MPRDKTFDPSKIDDSRIGMHDTLSGIITAHIQSVVEFAKALPNYSALTHPDQLMLIKAGFPEVWIVHAARTISFPDQSILFCGGYVVSKAELGFVFSV